MGVKRAFTYTRYYQEPDAAAAFSDMGERTATKLLAHEIIDAFFIYADRPAAITKTICAALHLMYEAGKAAGRNERTAPINRRADQEAKP